MKDIGEQGLLSIIQAFCPRNIIGDDAAILDVNPSRSLVVTTDVLVDGVHFSDRTTSASDVGWRCVAANLSDIAAMGAQPLGITVGLGLPANVAVDWVKSLYQGMRDCLDAYHSAILGGDLVSSPVITMNITALGEVVRERAIYRATAKLGDVILVTGFHGCARAGLELLLNPGLGENLEPRIKQKLIKVHQRPRPRIDVIKILEEIKSDVTISGMDSSDGLADAVIQICRCSGVGAEIYGDAIPIVPELNQLTEQALDWVLYGGEDFELVLCLPLSLAELLREKLGVGAAIIGKITQGNTVKLIDKNNLDSTKILNLSEGFQHF